MKYLDSLLTRIESSSSLFLTTIIALFSFFVFGNSLFNGFVWDDIGQIVQNPSIQNFSNILSFFSGSTFYSGGASQLTGVFYKPLLPLTFTINYALWGMNPFGFHLLSLLFHTINSALVFFLFNTLFAFYKYKHTKILSFLLTLLFVTHPANVEAVSYISAVQELLYVFFLLLSLLLTISWCKQKNIFTKTYFLSSLSVLLSLLSKDSGIVAIPILLAFVILFQPAKIKELLLSLTSVVGLYAILRFGLAKIDLGKHAIASPIVQASLVQRLFTIPYELFSYLRILFFPKDLFISQTFVITSIRDPRFFLALLIILLTFGIICMLVYKLKSRLSLVFLVWIFSSFILILNIYPLDFTLAERWLYGPLVGILGLFGTLVIRVKNKYIISILIILFLLTIPVFALRTIIRNTDWKDNKTLFSHDIIDNPSSYEIQEDYGTLIANAGNLKDGRKHLLEAIKLSPNWWAAYTNAGLLFEQEKNYKKAQSYFLYAINKGLDYSAFQALAVLEYKTNTPENTLLVTTAGLKYYPNNPTLNLIAALSYYKEGQAVNALIFAKNAYLLYPSIQTYTALINISNRGSIEGIIK